MTSSACARRASTGSDGTLPPFSIDEMADRQVGAGRRLGERAVELEPALASRVPTRAPSNSPLSARRSDHRRRQQPKALHWFVGYDTGGVTGVGGVVNPVARPELVLGPVDCDHQPSVQHEPEFLAEVAERTLVPLAVGLMPGVEGGEGAVVDLPGQDGVLLAGPGSTRNSWRSEARISRVPRVRSSGKNAVTSTPSSAAISWSAVSDGIAVPVSIWDR